MPTEFSNYIEARPSVPDVDVDGTEKLVASKDGEAVQLTAQQIADLGGGGGAVDSVNGQTGVVQVNADDVPLTPAGNIAATDVQAAIEELDSEKASTAYADGKVADAINNGTTTVAPSQNAVFDALALKMDSLITYRTLTASHTLDATDLASINAGDSLNILMNVASANDLTVPPNATQAFPVGTVIAIDQIGAGATTIVAGAGVTIRTSDGLVLANQYSGAYVQKVATNEWYAKGKLKL